MGVSFETAWVTEGRAGGRFSDDHVREREGRSLLEKLPARGTVVSLDPSGESLDSEQLASRLDRWCTPRATMLVGGPLGLHGSVLQRSDVIWSLSRLTFPHELARVLVVEQIYRALTIRQGSPYHK